MSIYIGNNNKIKNSIIGNNQNILALIQKRRYYYLWLW